MPTEDDLHQGPGVNDDPAAGDKGKEGLQDDQPGTISLEKHNATLADLQQQINNLADENRLYRVQMQMGRGGGDGGDKPGAGEDGFFQGREDEDVITVGELRSFESHLRQQFGGAMGEMQLAGQKADYQEVVQTHLPNFLRANPQYIRILRSALPQDRPRMAYDLGIQDPAYQAKKNKERLETDANPNAEAIRRNKQKPNLGGKGGRSPLSQAGRFEAMSDEELEKQIDKVMAGGVLE